MKIDHIAMYVNDLDKTRNKFAFRNDTGAYLRPIASLLSAGSLLAILRLE